MKKILTNIISLLVVTAITLVFSGLSIVGASATERNWINGPLYHREIPKPRDAEGCVNEQWTIKTDPRFEYRNLEYLPQDICVYYADGYVYAIHERMLTPRYYNDWTKESFVAVAVGEAISSKQLTPVKDMDLRGPGISLLHTEHSRSLFYTKTAENYNGMNIGVIDDFTSMLSSDDPVSGYFRLKSWGRILMNHEGSAYKIFGVGISANGYWVAGVMADRLVRINTYDGSIAVIAYSLFYQSDLWPPQGYSLYIDNNGTTLGYLGSNVNAEIFELTLSCINPDAPNSVMSNYIATSCKHNDLSVFMRPYSQPTSQYSGGVRSYLYPLLLEQGKVLSYGDSNDIWHQISYENFSGEKYLALGDSYASGEGDIDQYGAANHYINGTNIQGDYARGIPRETCHVSDRSYPFLLGNHAGLQRRYGIDSIACAGAIRLDVANTSNSFNFDEYVNGVYAGQKISLDFNGKVVPRLANLTNITALQQDAMRDVLPGRVQQIEQLKQQQPEVATVQISGNDLGFPTILSACLLNLPTRANPDCDWASPEFRNKIAYAIEGNRAELVALYRQLQTASPATQLYAVGYPLFVDQSAVCWRMASLSAAEQEFIIEGIKYANDNVKSAAAEAGIRYINIQDTLIGHAVCGGNDAMTEPLDFVTAAWMADMKRGQEADAIIAKYHIIDPAQKALLKNIYLSYSAARGASNASGASPMSAVLSTAQQLFHPNAIGHKMIADTIISALGDKNILNAECDGRIIICPSTGNSAPLRPTYFGDRLTATGMIVETSSLALETIMNSGSGGNLGMPSGITVIRRGSTAALKLVTKHVDLQNLKALLHSTPYNLEDVRAASTGRYEAIVSIPQDAAIGPHIIEIVGKTADGTDYSALQNIFVIGDAQDEDGDGIFDGVDTCLYTEPCPTTMHVLLGYSHDESVAINSVALRLVKPAILSTNNAQDTTGSSVGYISPVDKELEVGQQSNISTSEPPLKSDIWYILLFCIMIGIVATILLYLLRRTHRLNR